MGKEQWCLTSLSKCYVTREGILMDLQIELADHGPQITVYVSGEIDIYTAPDLKSNLLPLTKEKGKEVTVDLSNVNYMDSTGIGVFISALKSTKENESSLELVNLQATVLRLFEITGLNEIMDIKPAIRGASE